MEDHAGGNQVVKDQSVRYQMFLECGICIEGRA